MTVLDALQAALASEHALVHAYGVLGARTSQSGAPLLHASLVDAYNQHRHRRDTLRALVIEAGGTPVEAEAAYDPPARAGADGAAALEAASSASMAALVARTSGETRRWALGALVWSASREVLLGAAPDIWPGAPELGLPQPGEADAD